MYPSLDEADVKNRPKQATDPQSITLIEAGNQPSRLIGLADIPARTEYLQVLGQYLTFSMEVRDCRVYAFYRVG